MSQRGPSIIISGTGSYTPKKCLTNDDLAKIVDTSDEWIRTRTGIGERHLCADGEETSDLAVEAGKRAMEAAGVKPEEIDLLIIATITADMPFPSAACMAQHKLGLRHIPAFDLSAACSGFVYMLECASLMLRAGSYKKALVIGAEKMSSMLDWNDRTTCVLFGDGAGACVLERSDKKGVGILGNLLGSDGSNPAILCMPGSGSALPPTHESIDAGFHFLKMNGKEVFKSAVRVMEQATRDILEQHGLTTDDVALLVPHQANTRILDALGTRLAIPREKIFMNLERYGNTTAASIPLALDEAVRGGRVKSGDYVLFVAFGAGLTWASGLVKWH